MHKRPRRYSRTICGIVITILLTISIDVRSETRELPKCAFVMEQRVNKMVTVLINKAVDHPGSLCARVINEQESLSITYGYGDIRVERLWFGIVWSSARHLRDFFWFDQEPDVPALALILKPGEMHDSPLGTGDEDGPSGRYRIRFCYHESPEGQKKQCVYSEPISLP
jgi:hypothetical protein